MRFALVSLVTAAFLNGGRASSARLAAAEAEVSRLRSELESERSKVHLLADQPDQKTWAHDIVHSSANKDVNEMGDSNGVTTGFQDVEEVYAFTCIALLLAIFVAVFAIWRYIPWDEEWCGMKTGTIKTSLLMLSWFSSGAAVMMLVLGYQPVTAMYVMAQIVTTVGYGDCLRPTKWYSQLFLSFYSILCILLIAGTISSIADAAVKRFEEQMQERVGPRPNTQPAELSWFALYWDHYGDITTATVLFAIFIMAGTLYFGGFEGCTCSYGVTAIYGCSERTQEECRASGGIDMSYMEAFYMSCITMTTVGFGDFSAHSYYGRIFATFWMILGVAATGNFVRAFSMVYMEQRFISMDVEECFDQIDENGDGYLSRFEFVCFVLLETGMMNKQTMDSINEQYDSLDTERTDRVTLEMIKKRGSSTITLEATKAPTAANSILQSTKG